MIAPDTLSEPRVGSVYLGWIKRDEQGESFMTSEIEYMYKNALVSRGREVHELAMAEEDRMGKCTFLMA